MRALLTVLGLTMGVATIITVMTLIQGANLYVEQKIANLGTNVFQISKMPPASTDFNLMLKAIRHKNLYLDDAKAVATQCSHCQQVGATASSSLRTSYRDRELEGTRLIGHTPAMVNIDTSVIEQGRYFTELEDTHSARVCLAGDKLIEEFFPGEDPLGRVIRAGNEEFTVIGVYEKIGAILGQERDNYIVVPMSSFLKMRGTRQSVTISVQASGGAEVFQQAQDEARLALRAQRQRTGAMEDDFFIATASSYIALWQQISGAFFAVFILVSAISALVGGIVIMNVMLVSVTDRTKEIGVRRAMGATQADIRRQFLAESVLQCLAGGAIGIGAGFATALVLRSATAFPASVQTGVAVLGLGLSSAIGLFFGIYPAVRAARLDPVAALRSE